MRGRVIKKILLNVSCLFLGVVFTGRAIALENAGAINTALGVKTYEIVSRSEEESDEYVHYYPTVYGSIKELKEAGYAKAQEVEAEGAVLLKNDHGTLPLAKGEVSVFGITSVYPVYAGTGCIGTRDTIRQSMQAPAPGQFPHPRLRNSRRAWSAPALR